MAEPSSFSVWNYLPNFDGQTTFTFVVGTIITLLTFWVGYKKTIGAQEERTRAANQDLIASALHRVAVERELMRADQFSHIRDAKAYLTSIPVNRLIEFGEALSVVLAETIDNNFLDQDSKNKIIELLESSRATIEAGPSPDEQNPKERETNIRRLAFASLGMVSAVVGLFASILSKFAFGDGRPDKQEVISFLYALVGFGVIVIVLLVFMGIIVDPRSRFGRRFRERMGIRSNSND